MPGVDVTIQADPRWFCLWMASENMCSVKRAGFLYA